MKKILTMYLFFFSTINFAQENEIIKREKHIRAAEAYGYIVGFEITFEKITTDFPELQREILDTKHLFQSTFSNVKTNSKLYLETFFGKNEFLEFEKKNLEEFKSNLDSKNFDQKEVLNYLADIKSKARGKILSPILENLLSFQYFNNPEKEFLSGFIKTFKTKDHIKSKNTDWNINLPKSWLSLEADRPNIIQKFISDMGNGNESVMLTVKDLDFPKNYKLTKEDYDEIFNENTLKEMIPEGGKFKSFKNMTFDGIKGAMLESEQSIQRLDLLIKTKNIQYVFIFKNKLYSISCTVATTNENDNLEKISQKFKPLFTLIANSIVINEQYK